MTMLASVVIAYNEKTLLEITLPPIKQISDQVVIVDMGSTDGSHELYAQLLGPGDQVVFYPRDNLFRFGFSHPRNFGAKFTRSDWILAVDCDEYLDVAEVEAAKLALAETEAKCFSVNRKNYIKGESAFSPSNIQELLAHCPFTVEPHRRLYRNQPNIRFEGMIHEELWVGDINAYYDCSEAAITLHHLNQFKQVGSEYLKYGLYSYITLQGIIHPGMRFGTNEFWFTEFPRDNLDTMLASSDAFADAQQLPRIDAEAVKVQLAKEVKTA